MIVTCNCQAISLTLPDELPPLQICHCVNCRRFTGGLGAYLVPLPGSAVTVTGSPKEHAVSGFAGRNARRFWCADCGCSLYDRNDAGDMAVMAGLLPPGSVPKPGSEIWCRDMEEWEHLYVPKEHAQHTQAGTDQSG